MWVHPDIFNDEQWESNQSKRKGKSCNMISFALSEDDNIPINPLSDSEEEQIVLVAQPTDTRSGKTYLRQYDQAVGEAQPSTSKDTPPVQPTAPAQPVEKNKSKDLHFNHSLKKNTSGLETPFRFDIMAQLANIPARITLHELLRISKETRDALRKALAESESFLAQVPQVPAED